jgi:CDP-glucose 4,6-dehydratase
MTKIEFWKGRNVLITGINGFIGGNLAKTLCNFGANIVGIIRNQNKKSFLYYEGIADKVNLVNGNVTDKELIMRVISEERISVVFHLAAQVEVGIAQVYPYLTWETNIKGTYSLLEAIRENSVVVKAAVIASTDKAYGSYEEDKLPYREEYPLVPVYPYDVSKACADMIAKAYSSGLYSLPIIITRFCNIYGPGQLNFSALIPDAIRAALGHGKFIPRSNGLSVRDYIFIDDVIHLYMLFAEKLATNKDLRGEIFNAGTNKPKRVKEIVKQIYSNLKKKKEYLQIDAIWSKHKTLGEIDCQYMNYDKLNSFFGWSPSIDFDSGIEQTIAWYEEYLKRIA